MILSGSNKVNVLPRTLTTRLTYAETFSFTTGAAGIIGSRQLMCINSAYDPNDSGVGHQPYGYDQLTPFYNNYIVKRCKYKLLCTTIGSTSEVAVVMQLFPTGGGVTIAGATVDRATECSTCSVLPVGPSGNDRCRLVEGVVNLHDLFGVTKTQYETQLSTYGAANNSSPSSKAYMEVAIGSYSGAAAVSLSIQIILEMDVEFFAPVTLPQS